MKNFKYLGLSLIGLLVISCAKQLELEPQQSISENIALETDGNVKAVLIGAYDELGNGNLWGGNVLRNSELLGGDGEIQWVGTFNGPREIFTKNMIAVNGDAQALWITSYNTINIANNVLSAIDVVNTADQNRVRGEALFIRAAVYFELVRMYAKQFTAGGGNDQPGVPLVLTPTRGITEENNIARSSVGAVYGQIITDLREAASLLDATNDVYASADAANALLARVYLQQGDYTAARDLANQVISSGNYALNASYADAFNNDANSSEDIFAMQVTNQDGVNNMNTFFSIPDFGGRDGDIDILDGHLSLYDPLDTRLALFYEGNGAIRSGKWNNQFGNIPVIRLAEMYLIRAESNMRLGTDVGAAPVDDYNQTHTRAGLEAAASVTLDDILLERRLELAHEGFKIHDMRRNGIGVGGLSSDDDRLVFPIPDREIVANPNLTQNPGY